MTKSWVMIPKLNYTDTSTGQSSQIIREIQQLREDVKVSNGEIADEIKPKKNLNSPYAPDRMGEQKILGSEQETDWKRRLDIIY